MRTARILVGDVRDRLQSLPAQSVQTCVTSPPYWGLRNYQMDGQLGLESTPDAYVQAMVEVFREVRRVLRNDGTVWLNLGDSYANNGQSGLNNNAGGTSTLGPNRDGLGEHNKAWTRSRPKQTVPAGLKPKDLVGIPWRVAFALQADGWYLRSDIIWSKPNPMPESVTDRPTKAHEYIFLLTKRASYYYDAEAIAETSIYGGKRRAFSMGVLPTGNERPGADADIAATRNKRSVWHVATQPFSGAHFAVFPEALIEPCILAGSSERGQCPQCGAPWERVVERGESDYARINRETGCSWRDMNAAAVDEGKGLISHRAHIGQTRDENGNCFSYKAAPSKHLGWQATCTCDAGEAVPQTILDPFCGSGTTGVVSCRHNRHFLGVELNPAYAELAYKRITGDAALLNRVEVA
jgi:DNA modification methylase